MHARASPECKCACLMIDVKIAVCWCFGCREMGGHVASRALGVFFQEKIIDKFEHDLMQEKRNWFFAPLKYAFSRPTEKNEVGGHCCYGEFPLSFAAAVGDEHACHLLFQRASRLINMAVGNYDQDLADSPEKLPEHDEVLYLKSELDRWIECNIQDGQERLKIIWKHLGRTSKTDVSFLRTSSADLRRTWQNHYKELLTAAFMNRRDSNGDTALHFAVRHRRLKTIDFLLEHGALPSLEFLNDKNLTPLTLAVREEGTQTFDHMVMKQRQVIWTYGGLSAHMRWRWRARSALLTRSVPAQCRYCANGNFVPRTDRFVSDRAHRHKWSARTRHRFFAPAEGVVCLSALVLRTTRLQDSPGQK